MYINKYYTCTDLFGKGISYPCFYDDVIKSYIYIYIVNMQIH